MHALVIGAGLGGIASALRLRAKGYQVTVIDRCAQLGGRAQVYERGGFRHDSGPTVITAPFLFEELFQLFGEKLSDHVKLVPLNPWYRFEFADGEHFDYGGTLMETIAEIRRIEPLDCAGYMQLLKHSQKIFDLAFTTLATQPFDKVLVMIKQIPRLLRLKSYLTVWELASKYLKNKKLLQAFTIQPLLLGGNPFQTTSIYSLIHFLEREYGVHFVMGGTHALVSALEKLMIRNGITIRLSETIKCLSVESGKAVAAVLESGEVLPVDLVVSNADPLHLYRRMLNPKYQSFLNRFKAKRPQVSMGLFILYFGTLKPYPSVAHHTIWMGQRYRELLDDIFNKKLLSEDFSLYLHRPSATDPSFAPTGCDSFYVLCPVPNLLGGQDWSVEGPKLRNRIVNALERTILPGLSETITEDFYKTPKDFEFDYLSEHGAGFSVAPTFTQSAWFRFHNRSESLKNLYLVGAGTHPGAGLPGVISSAKLVASMLPNINGQL
jgi:phytoene desaturase